MTSVWVAEHGCVYLTAAIDCCTREIVAWHLEVRCRAREAIALIERAAAERQVAPGTLTLGTDNGSAFTARTFKAVLGDLGIAHRRGGYRDPEAAQDELEGSRGERGAVVGPERKPRGPDRSGRGGVLDERDRFGGAASELEVPADDLARATVDRGHQITPAVLGDPD